MDAQNGTVVSGLLRGGTAMTGERDHNQDLAALHAVVIEVAIRYRDAMRRYLAEQSEAMVQGATLEELVTDNWPSFQETAQAETELFALLDMLEATQAHAADATGARGGNRCARALRP
jgi:hypothetical protein